jgi:hypothetical protein
MRPILLKTAAAFVVTALCGALAFAQVSTTGSISGTVTDQAGAVVAGATVVVKNNDTGVENTKQTADNGTFSVASLPAGTYTVTVTASNFKKSVVQDVKVNVGTPSTINVGLEVGSVGETVTITGGGGELLQTQSATVGTTITGRQITDIPFTSRDALDLVLLLPGTNTPGTPRTSTVNGLPKGSLNITIDGVNVQDNNLKSDFGGGFFTYIRPRIDAIDEVTVSTATPGAESAGEGAVQIKFVTRGGSNDLRGSLYWYHRNPVLNANYYFNNLAGLPRDRVLLNQYGGRAGGPVWIPGVYNGRDKTFWFVNYEEYRLPEQTSRTRTILTPLAEQGIFTTTSGRQINLLAEAAATNCGTAAQPVPCASTIDPTIGRVLGAIRASLSAGSVTQIDPNRAQFNFTNTGGQTRFFTAVRFDHNLTDKHRIENVWNYQVFNNPVDFLNGVDPAFPGFVAGVGGQDSLRFSNSTALRSNLTPNVVNEARFALTGGTSLFRAQLSPASFSELGGLALSLNSAGLGLSNPFVSRSNQRRNSPVKTFTDTVTWVKGTHSINFGGSFSIYSLWSDSLNNLVPQVNFGLVAADPASAVFNRPNFAGLPSADISQAQGLYALLTGRVTGVFANAYPDEESGNFTLLGNTVVRLRQREYGLFAQDSWRARPNLTLNFGLRWEVQEPFESKNNTLVQTGFDQLFGITGPTRQPTQFNLFPPGQKAYDTDYGNLAPSVGIAWSPNWRSGILHRFFGEGGQTVLRAGYSVAYVREGLNVATSIFASNPGAFLITDRTTTIGNLTPGSLLRTPATLAPPAFSATRTFPLTGGITNSANVFEPGLKTGYVQSWTAGIQRELTKDMVVEARYVSNRGVKLWQQINFNEVNIGYNGFFNEFRAAMANLQANIAAGRGANFRYFGPGTNTNPLPITLAFFSGVNPADAANCVATATPGRTLCSTLYNSALFTNALFVNALLPQNASPQGFAANLYADAGRRTNAFTTAGVPRNIFLANPDLLGGAWAITNNGRSYYDALQIDVRRRMANGLLIQGNYTWGKSLTNMFGSSSAVAIQPVTLRNDRLSRVNSTFDIRHAVKANWIYELPFGRGRQWLADSNGLVDRLIGGWEWHGAARLQSGTPFSFGNVQLVGMTKQELQDAIEIRRNGIQPNGATSPFPTYLPDDIILNTFRAFNVGTAGYTQGAPQGRYIAPASSHGCLQEFAGQCGFSNLVLYGPKFARWDMSVVKKVRITERTNFEFRTEFLNAFNNINFKIGAPGAETVFAGGFATQTFGQTNQAYRDISTTNDPGGRIIQFVGRFNF